MPHKPRKSAIAWTTGIPLPNDWERPERIAWLRDTLADLALNAPEGACTDEFPCPVSNLAAAMARCMVHFGDNGTRVYLLPHLTRTDSEKVQHVRAFKVSEAYYREHAEEAGMIRAVEKLLSEK